MKFLPHSVYSLIKKWFKYPEEVVFCQVSTSHQNIPSLRTMALYDITGQGELIFLSRIDTKKWSDLLEKPYIAVCMLSHKQHQIILEGSVSTKTIDNDKNFTNFYWNKMPPACKEIYKNKDENSDFSYAPMNFGCIVVQANSFDVLEICFEEYIKSKRTFLHRRGNNWEEKSLKVS